MLQSTWFWKTKFLSAPSNFSKWQRDIGQIYIFFLGCFLFGGLQVHSKTTWEIFTTEKIRQLLQFLKKIKAIQLCIKYASGKFWNSVSAARVLESNLQPIKQFVSGLKMNKNSFIQQILTSFQMFLTDLGQTPKSLWWGSWQRSAGMILPRP